MNKRALWLPILFSLVACNDTNKKTQDESDKKYFPINTFISGEIRTIDSLPVGIMKKSITGSIRDSGFIQLPEFNQLSLAFTDPALNSPGFEANYSESAFGDETTGYFTFNYLPKQDTLRISRVDVIAKPGADIDKVQSVYIEKKYTIGDTAILQKLFWRTQKGFTIWTEKRVGSDSTSYQHKLEVIWDPSTY